MNKRNIQDAPHYNEIQGLVPLPSNNKFLRFVSSKFILLLAAALVMPSDHAPDDLLIWAEKTMRKFLGLVFALLLLQSAVPQALPKASPSPTPATAQAPVARSSTCAPNYYRNSYGVCIHRPLKTQNSAAPQGASAQCRDGSYSFSQHHRGTCSHHGGVARWL
jgi:hypothetical protein